MRGAGKARGRRTFFHDGGSVRSDRGVAATAALRARVLRVDASCGSLSVASDTHGDGMAIGPRRRTEPQRWIAEGRAGDGEGDREESEWAF